MNHPSDYMPNYRDSQSSDSSNHEIYTPKNTFYITSHKNKREIEFVRPKKQSQTQIKDKKKTKSTFQKSTIKNKNKAKHQKHSKFDIFVYGGSFYSCGNVDEISNRLKQNDKQTERQKVMIQQRLRRRQRKCITKIQKYLKGFLITNAKKVQEIKQVQKLELYNMLKKQREEEQEQNVIELILKQALQELQEKCYNLLQIYPTQSQAINRWKNIKMHQLMTAQSFLLRQNQLDLDIFNLRKEIQLLNQQKFFPEMRQEAHELLKQIINHIQCQESQATTKLQDQMVLWVLNQFLAFIYQRQDIWAEIASILQYYWNGIRDRPLIRDQIYVQFQKSEIGQDESYDQENPSKLYMHFFNKSVIDLINEVAWKFDKIYPSIQCLKEIVNSAKMALISGEPIIQAENSLAFLDVSHMIFEQLLEDFIQDFLDFL